MTQEQTAQKLGLTQATYSRYENGTNEPDVATLKNISRRSIDFLLECEETDNSASPIELLSLIRNGIFTVNGKFLTQKEREKLLNIIKILYEV